MTRKNNRPADMAEEQIQKLLLRVVSIYAKAFNGSEGKKHLAGKGIDDNGLYENHSIGYCNGNLEDILPSQEKTINDLESISILKNGEEYFNGCIVLPIYDIEGGVNNLIGVNVATNKTLSLPSRSKSPWNINIIKTCPEAIITDSIIDALSLEVAGCPNVLTLLDDDITDDDNKLFKEYGVQNILRMPDDFNANNYLNENGKEELRIYVNELGSGNPVDSGADRSLRVNSSQTPYSLTDDSFTLSFGVRQYEIIGLEKGKRKLKATVRVEHGGQFHLDTLNFYIAKERKQLSQAVCRVFSELPATIEADINKIIKECEHRTPKSQVEDVAGIIRVEGKAKEEAEAFGKSPDLIDNILKDYEACGLIGEEPNKLLSYLGVTSRKMDEPLSVLILSSSGSGKTALQDSAVGFCPEEDLVKLTSMSGKALFYKKQRSLKHKVLAIEEVEGVEDANYAIRNIISAGELLSESTIKDISTGKLTTMENKVEGPVAVFVTTTDPAIDPETKSRFLVTSIDESREQTKSILSFQRQRQTEKGLSGNMAIEAIRKKHQNFQRLLKPLAVVNPYADKLTYSDDRLQSRRDQKKYLNLINSVAFLRQMSKSIEQTGNGDNVINYIKADIEDIRIANELAQEIIGKSLDELSRPSRELLLQVDEMVEERWKKDKDTPRTDVTFSRRNIREFAGWSNYRVHTHLKELIDLEYVVIDSGRSNSIHQYRLPYEGQGKQGERFILGLKPIEELNES